MPKRTLHVSRNTSEMAVESKQKCSEGARQITQFLPLIGRYSSSRFLFAVEFLLSVMYVVCQDVIIQFSGV